MFAMLSKLPIVGIFGQGTPIDADRIRLAQQLGAMVAELGAHLLTGGGYGVMEAAAAGFVAVSGRAGLSIGIVPRHPDGPFDLPNREPTGQPYPNPFVEIAIMTPLPALVPDWRREAGRNHVNVLTADAVVALPGKEGTLNELDMAAEYFGEAARPREQRRTILVGPIEAFSPAHRALFVHAASLDEVAAHVRRVMTARGLELGRQS